jgi:hypothetical protein
MLANCLSADSSFFSRITFLGFSGSLLALGTLHVLKTINLSCCEYQEQFSGSDTSVSVSTGDLATTEKFPTGYAFFRISDMLKNNSAISSTVQCLQIVYLQIPRFSLGLHF